MHFFYLVLIVSFLIAILDNFIDIKQKGFKWGETFITEEEDFVMGHLIENCSNQCEKR